MSGFVTKVKFSDCVAAIPNDTVLALCLSIVGFILFLGFFSIFTFVSIEVVRGMVAVVVAVIVVETVFPFLTDFLTAVCVTLGLLIDLTGLDFCLFGMGFAFFSFEFALDLIDFDLTFRI